MQGSQALTAVAATAPAIALCDQKGCNEPAKYSYTWEWGESGKCCGTHQFTLNQTAGNISRQIQFQPLDSGVAPPIQRDERIAFHARALTLEAELGEAKTRGLELYNQSVQLTAQVQSLTVHNRELQAQVKDARTELQALRTELDAQRAQNGDLADEAGRLRVLIQRPPASVSELERELAEARVELKAYEQLLGESDGSDRSRVGLAPPAGESSNPAK